MFTNVRTDKKGLFVIAEGWVGRPTEETKFHKGERVKVKHRGGTPLIWVGRPNINFKKHRQHVDYEVWFTDELRTK